MKCFCRKKERSSDQARDNDNYDDDERNERRSDERTDGDFGEKNGSGVWEGRERGE